MVTTGSEVFHGRIQDTFTPVIVDKLRAYGMEMTVHELSDDGMDNIVAAIEKVRKAGVDLVLCTGGMSVDPDDNTPGAIKTSGAKIVTYGAPVLPGAMFLLGYYDDGTPVMGLPGCVMYAGATIFDLILPRVAADVPVTRAEIAAMGNGGLCLGCKECRYPSVPSARAANAPTRPEGGETMKRLLALALILALLLSLGACAAKEERWSSPSSPPPPSRKP